MQIIDFKKTVLPLSTKMIRLAGYLLNDQEEAKDIVQDVFLKLWQIREELNGIRNISAFVTRMVKNRCADRHRLNKKLRVMESPHGKEEYVPNDTDPLVMKETCFRIRQLIAQLPVQQQTVIYLRDIEQNDYWEIEDITGLSTNAIRANLSRARKKIREELLKTWQNDETRGKDITEKIL